MTITKGQPWGEPAPLPGDGVTVRSDGAARRLVEDARRRGVEPPVIGLLGGDLCRTVGGRGDAGRLRSAEAVTFPVDVGSVLVDGRQHWFVAHLVVRSRLWAYAFVAMNAQWLGSWNLGPRAHPNDGLLDTYEARLPFAERRKVRARLPLGSHLPHPGIEQRRTKAVQLDVPHGARVHLDGEDLGPARTLSIRVEPDALRVVV